jgi:hypothetical protein
MAADLDRRAMNHLTITAPKLLLEIVPQAGPALTLQTPASLDLTLSVVGVQGPPGNGARHTHVQAAALLVWTVPHNLGFRPNVTVTTTGGQEVWGGEVLHLSVNTLTITFDVAMAGSADCV